MDDVAPELLRKIQEYFQEHYKNDDKINTLLEKLQSQIAKHSEAYDYAERVGEILADAYAHILSSEVLPEGKMWYNIGNRIISPTLEENYGYICDYVSQVQEQLNQTAGIGIKPIIPSENKDREKGIIDRLSSEENFDDVAWILQEPVKTIARSIVDDSIQVNAEFHGKSGMQPKIVRKSSGKCCEWCNKLEGTYRYPNVPKDVYRRHERCRCTVEYDPGNGKRQNVHTNQWKDKEEYDKIEARKIANLLASDDVMQKHIREEIIPQQFERNITQRQDIHRVGTKLYQQRKRQLQEKGQYGPSYITISDDEIMRLVEKYSGKGDIRCDRSGKWNNQETIVTNDKIIGVVFNNQNGKSAETSVFKIHYSEKGIHIVPDYPSKKR